MAAPRALEFFGQIAGYEAFAAERCGTLASPPALSDALEWDRPCQGRRCPAAAH